MKITEKQLRNLIRESIIRVIKESSLPIEEVISRLGLRPSSKEAYPTLEQIRANGSELFVVEVNINGQDFVSPIFDDEDKAFDYANELTDGVEQAGYNMKELNASIEGFFENTSGEDIDDNYRHIYANDGVISDTYGYWEWDDETGGFWND